MRKRLTTAAAIALLVALVGPGCTDEESNTETPHGVRTPRHVTPVTTMPVETDAMDAKHKETAQRLVKSGMEFLLGQQEDNGGWRTGTPVGPALTALILKALIQHPDFDMSSPTVKRGYDYLLGFRQKDGGIYDLKNPHYANYTSSIALMSLVATGDPKFTETKRDLIAYLRGLQIAPGSKDPKGRTVQGGEDILGGAGYGTRGDPDGSNTGMWAEALHQAGVPGDDPAMQAMAGFFTRLQNRTESNTTTVAMAGTNDGGFYYAIDESKAGPDGKGLRSYGSMTYMGFKSMIYAGLTKDDPRVASAFEWIRRHWTLEKNPNLPYKQSLEGLYYYYHTYAKALRAWGQPVIKDTKGKEHNWREELIDELAGRATDGHWFNKDSPRWMEGDPLLVTAYAVLSLQETMGK